MQQILIKPLAKGQITIPAKFRKKLSINENTLYEAELDGGGIFLKPVKYDSKEKYIRSYSDDQVSEFLGLDKLDEKAKKKFAKYLKD